MDGLIVIDKQKQYTSHDVVAKVKKILQVSKVGHTGTLDPNATGVLPILLGKGTKLSKYLINHDKVYEVTMQLGQKTTTGDSEGEISEEKEVQLEKLEPTFIKRALKNSQGKQKQYPPMYSAIKVKGKKLYEYARQGKQTELQPRQIEIYEMKLEKVDIEKKQIEFQVACSKGTYIRTVCENIAEKLQTVGYMKELRRLQVGNFTIENAIKIEQLEQMAKQPGKLEKSIFSFEEIVKEYPGIILEEKDIIPFYHGVKLKIEKPNQVYRIYGQEGRFLGTGTLEKGFLKRDILIKEL